MANCELCGKPMPEGEEMFKYHGQSGPCPSKPMSTDDELNGILELVASVSFQAGHGNGHHEGYFMAKPKATQTEYGIATSTGGYNVKFTDTMKIEIDQAKAAIQAHYAAQATSTHAEARAAYYRGYTKATKHYRKILAEKTNHLNAIDVLKAEIRRLTALWCAGEMSREELDGQADGLRSAMGILREPRDNIRMGMDIIDRKENKS